MTSSSEDIKVVTTILTEIVRLREHPVVLIGATNAMSALDRAAVREGRFDFKVEVTAPDEAARLGILLDGLRRFAPELEIDQPALLSIARRWSGFSASRLVAVVKALPSMARERGLQRLGFDGWLAALKVVQGRTGARPPQSVRLVDLYLDGRTRDGLQLIVERLRDVHRAEEAGGTLPRGILLSGPPGTGKTVAAQALACESGWTFLCVTGPDLLIDRQRMSELYREACDLRPALVFVDEADDVLRDRYVSAAPDVVNRLLALLDGTNGRVADVIFVAATNHPEQIDPALLRPGRFDEKIAFTAPPARQVRRAVREWLVTRRVRLAGDVSEAEIVALLLGRTIADVRGVLQYSLNRAVVRRSRGGTTRAMLRRDDLNVAVDTVLARHDAWPTT
jgi:transitional endoplasmic reticulum ATPase